MKTRRKLAVILTVALLLQMLPLPMGCLAAVWDAAGINQVAEAADPVVYGTQGNIEWEYVDNQNNPRTLKLRVKQGVTGPVDMKSCGKKYVAGHNRTDATWGVHALDTDHIVIESGINNVSQNAFYGFDMLQSVQMDHVTEIGESPFSGCTTLQTVSMPIVNKIGKNAFYNCRALTGKAGMDNVKEIGESAFSGCTALQTVSMPNVEKIGKKAFAGCTALTGTVGMANVKEIGESAFSGCIKLSGPVAIPSNKVTTIGASAFSGCTALTSVTIGEGVTTIGDNAFASSGLTSITFPKTVTAVGKGVLSNTKLKEVLWPPNVKTISESAFQQCPDLTEITIPDWVTKIDKTAFYQCAGLTKVNIADKADGSGNNSGKIIGESAFSNCLKLAEVKMGEKVQEIGKLAFDGCLSLTKLTLPQSSLKKIQEDCFNGTGLTEFTVPASVETIGINPWVGGKLQKFTVAPDSQKFAVDNGMLVEKKDGGTYTVISYPCEGNNAPTVSASVREIRKNAFRETKITAINFSEGLETVGVYAFYQSSLENVKTPKSLRGIGDWAFADMKGLQSVELSEGLETIGTKAFYMSSLESVKIPGSIRIMGSHAFASTTKLKSAELSEGLGAIGTYAFSQSSLESLKTPKSLRTIGNYAFEDTTKLVSVEFLEGLETIGASAFSNSALESLKTPKSLQTIGNNAFEDTTKLANVEFLEGLETIGADAFMTSSLGSLKTPKSLRTIGNHAFAYTSKLGRVELSEGLQTIGTSAFWQSSLESVKLPKSLREINRTVFAWTAKLKNVEFSEGLVIIRAGAFQGATALQRVTLPGSLKTIEYNAFWGDTALETVDAAGGKMETIGSSAFNGCGKLQNVLLGGDLREIGASAFNNCVSIKEIALPDKMNTLGDSVFSGCSNLKTIDFPNSITSIGRSALSGCTALKRATFGSVIREISGDVFENCPSITEITVSVRNPNMLSENNIVYSKDKKKLIYYAAGLPGEKFSVPDGVEVIGSKSFTYCVRLEEIRFPVSVKSVRQYAVYKNKRIGKLFFLGNGPEPSVGMRQDNTGHRDPNTTIYNYTQYNDSIAENGVGVQIYALPGTTGWGKGWTEKTKEDTTTGTAASGIKEYKYKWENKYDFNNKDWDPSKTDVSDGSFGGLTWKYRDDVGEIKFSGKGVIPDFPENKLPTWTDKNDVSKDHMQDIRLVKTSDATEIEIGNNAFRGASRLRRILAGDHLTRIGQGAFAGCTSLEHVDVYCVGEIEKEAFLGDTAIVDDLDVRNAKTLGEGAFKGCSSMKELLLGEKLTTIGAEAFSSCSALDTMIVPESVTSIGERCFKGCASLRTVNIPNKLRAIPAESFADCKDLQKVYFYGDYPNSWAADSFASPNKNLKIYYRAGNKTWSNAGNDWNGIPLVALDKFYTVGKDAYSFVDSQKAFGYDNNYYIPMQRYATALQSLVLGVYYQALDGVWRGSCFGMASSTMEFYEGNRHNVKDYNKSASNVHDLTAPKNYNADLTKVIEIYQASQHADEIGSELYSNFGKYRSLVRQVEEFERSGGLRVDAEADPVMICVYKDYSGHALLPVTANMDQQGNYILDVYDCRYPGALQKMEIKKDFSGIRYKEYKSASFVKYSTVRDVLKEADFTGQNFKRQGKVSNKVYLAVNQEKVSLTNGGGRDHTEIKEAFEQHLVAAGNEGEDTFSGIRSFVLPQDEYKMKAESAQGDVKYYAASDDFFTEVETSDKDAQLTVKGYRGEDNDIIAVKSEHSDTEMNLAVMDRNGVKKEISLKGSNVSIEMKENNEMTVEVSEDAKDVKLDGNPLTLKDHVAKVSFVVVGDQNPMEISQMRCDVSLDDQNLLSGRVEACLSWLKKTGDNVKVTATFRSEKGDIIAEHSKEITCEFGMQQVELDFDKVKINTKEIKDGIPVTCELKMVDSKGKVARISQENIVLKNKTQNDDQDPVSTPKPVSTPGPVSRPEPVYTPEPMITPEPTKTPEPTDTPEPDMTQQPQVSPVPDGSETPSPDETMKPETTAKPKPSKTPKKTVPKKGKVLSSGSLKYIVLKSAKKNGKVAVYGAKKKNASKVSIPEKVKLKGYSFKVTEIYQNAFKDMKKLSDVKIGGNVTSIGNNAFQNCRKMRFIIIPKKVKKIGGKAFAGCKGLSGMLVQSNQIKSLGSKAFAGITSKMKVKTSKKMWRKYAKMFQGKGGMSSRALFVINPVKLKYNGKSY